MATIYQIWMMRHVDVPSQIAASLAREMRVGKKANQDRKAPKYIPVVVTVNHKKAQTTLVPAGGGRYRMQVNTALRRSAGVDTGDAVSIELRLDVASRELPVPDDLRAGLRDHPRAWKIFQNLPPGHRRQFIQWFDSAKSSAARERRLERAIDHLLERAIMRSTADNKRDRK
jgi:hypothetical protein